MSDDPKDFTYTEHGDPHWSRVKRIFDEVLRSPGSERDAVLDRLCAGDLGLRAEVLQLVADFEEAGDFLNPPRNEPEPKQAFEAGAVLVNRFRVLEFLGRGGMGQVYRAEDMLSGGPVALKAIRPEIAADERNSRRLKRELRLSRQVSHPNVCRVYELWSTQSADGQAVVFLTMELLEGETLARRLTKTGRMQPHAALAIAKQIASGIAEVHRIGIIHRDVKPSNVYLVQDGKGADRAVVMDFGLARIALTGAAQDLTQTGALLGTPAYMAPELFDGKEATVASDVFGFGVTLYEMLTGRNRMMVAPRKLVPGLDAGWETAILECLDPDPKKRPPSMEAVIARIERGSKGALRKRLAIAASLCVIICSAVAFAIFAFHGAAPDKPAQVTRLTFDRGLVEEVSFTADGKTFAYSSDQNTPSGNLSIWIQDRITGDRRQLVRSPWHDFAPAISPDGKLVAFRSERNGSGIYTVPTAGGSPNFLVANGQNPRFSSDGRMLAYWVGQPGDVSDASGRAWVIPVTGGSPEPIAPNFADVRFPVWSPRGREVMFWGAPTAHPTLMQDTDWYVEDMDRKTIVRTRAFAQLGKLTLDPHRAPVFWGANEIVFSARSAYSNNIWAMSFSPASPTTPGPPRRRTTGSGFEVVPWLLPDGKIAYANWNAACHIWRASDLPGLHEPEPITNEDARDLHPTVSNDGRFLLFLRFMSDVQTMSLQDLRDGSEQTLTKAARSSPVISPDGSMAASSERTAGGNRIWIKTVRSGAETMVCEACGDVLSWLPDGHGLLFLRALPSREKQVSLLDLASRDVTPVLSGGRFSSAAVSPNGRQIAFTVTLSGIRSSIYTAPFARGTPTSPFAWKLFTDGTGWDEKPQWSRDGNEIFFSSNRDGFVCIWRKSIAPGAPPEALVHMHKAIMSPMHLAHVPTYNLVRGGKYVFFNAATLNGSLWMLEP